MLGHPVSIASPLRRRGGRMHDLYRCQGRELEAAKGLCAPGGPEGGPASPIRPMARWGRGLRGHSLTGSLWAVATLLCSQVFTGSGIRPVAPADARVAGGAYSSRALGTFFTASVGGSLRARRILTTQSLVAQNQPALCARPVTARAIASTSPLACSWLLLSGWVAELVRLFKTKLDWRQRSNDALALVGDHLVLKILGRNRTPSRFLTHLPQNAGYQP